MKVAHGWYFPDQEEHLLAWMAHPKNNMVLNGRQAYQGVKQAALLKLATNFRTAIDIGAHIGLWTHNLAAVFERVICFEPMAEHRECFAANIRADNVIVYPQALGSHPGMVTMRTGPASTGDTCVDSEFGGDVEMVTLDSFGFDEVDLVKIDAEGYEENILRGAAATIRRCLPVICVEQKRDFAVKYGLKPQGAIPYLQGLGYRVAKEISGDYLMVPT